MTHVGSTPNWNKLTDLKPPAKQSPNFCQNTDLEIRDALRNEDAHRIEKKQEEDHGPDKRAEALHDSSDNGLEFAADVHNSEDPPRNLEVSPMVAVRKKVGVSAEMNHEIS